MYSFVKSQEIVEQGKVEDEVSVRKKGNFSTSKKWNKQGLFSHKEGFFRLERCVS